MSLSKVPCEESELRIGGLGAPDLVALLLWADSLPFDIMSCWGGFGAVAGRR